MMSLSNIPEPTTAHRPDVTDESADVSPLATGRLAPDTDKPRDIDNNASEQQIDSVTCMLLLLIAGGLLRVVLGLLGPIQAGLDEQQLSYLAQRARQITAGDAADALPFFDLIAGSAITAGIPGWLIVLLGSLLTLAAVPATYIVGFTLTGRRVPGVLAGAVVAVHPAVLTASISLTSASLALSLVMIGLALICYANKRGTGHAVGGALLIGLAGLSAPLCWVVGLLAAPLAARLSSEHGPIKAVTHFALVLLLALGPVLGYRAAATGTNPQSLFAEFVSTQQSETLAYTTTGRWLINMSDPSLSELGDALMLPLGEAGQLKINGVTHTATRRDAVADFIADSWLLLNTALACLAALSIGVMLLRHRFVEVLVLAGPMLALAFCVLPASEALRLPLIALVGILSLGMLASKPIADLDEAALAKRAEQRVAKLAAKEEKQRARQEKRSNKELAKLYAFDEREAKSKKQPRKPADEPTALPTGILTERVADETPIPARPI